MRLVAVLVSFALGVTAVAEQFWIEYDASCGQFPEEVGWDRLVMSGGDQRSLDGGVLTLDSSAGLGVIDCYGISHPVDLGPGEWFLVEWRLRVDEVDGAAHPPVKPAITVGFNGYGWATFAYAESSLSSELESTWIEFDPYVFHDYSLTTSDLLTYTLRIDGSVAHTGRLVTPCFNSAVDWGDKATGATSVSDWEYVRFGVIPEPSRALLIISACLAGFFLRAREQGGISMKSYGCLSLALCGGLLAASAYGYGTVTQWTPGYSEGTHYRVDYSSEYPPQIVILSRPQVGRTGSSATKGATRP